MVATGWTRIRKTDPHDPSKKLFDTYNQTDGKLIHMNYKESGEPFQKVFLCAVKQIRYLNHLK